MTIWAIGYCLHLVTLPIVRPQNNIIQPISSFHRESLQSFCSDVFPPITTAISGSIKHMVWFQRFDGATEKTKNNMKSNNKLGLNSNLCEVIVSMIYCSWSSGPLCCLSWLVQYYLCCSFLRPFSLHLGVGMRTHHYSLYPPWRDLSDQRSSRV